MIAGIEIGGTKLQVAIADAVSPHQLLDLRRREVDRAQGATGIRHVLQEMLADVRSRYTIEGIGVGFGGPVLAAEGWVITSHQVAGWDDFPLADWLTQTQHVPVTVGNDCNVAALAEAQQGAGQGRARVFYVTIGTGIGGGFVVGGRIDGEASPAIAEIGHLRPGLAAHSPRDTVESYSSGLGMERRLDSLLDRTELQGTDRGAIEQLRKDREKSGRPIAANRIVELACAGQPIAERIFTEGARVLGWALAQATTLLAPDCIVIGGGVAQAGEPLFALLREAWATYVFPPLRDSVSIVPSQLGDAVVLHGAILAGMQRAKG